jgi:hypothetical protein
MCKHGLNFLIADKDNNTISSLLNSLIETAIQYDNKTKKEIRQLRIYRKDNSRHKVRVIFQEMVAIHKYKLDNYLWKQMFLFLSALHVFSRLCRNIIPRA